jgi:hypothetical protein
MLKLYFARVSLLVYYIGVDIPLLQRYEKIFPLVYQSQTCINIHNHTRHLTLSSNMLSAIEIISIY